uniref:nodavirus endopeptidase n=1 Tax=Picornavirales sp. TaxID=1955153 RepID=A0A6M3YNV4_9VIRU|nr:MAG: hypothetical protein 2 [Picornavirales sp.]
MEKEIQQPPPTSSHRRASTRRALRRSRDHPVPGSHGGNRRNRQATRRRNLRAIKPPAPTYKMQRSTQRVTRVIREIIPAAQRRRRPRRRPRMRRRRNLRNAGAAQGMRNMLRMSGPGQDFLKCAFAPPDFNTDPGQGIPDQYNGKVLPRKQVSTTAITFAPNRQTCLIFAPTPGVAYWRADVPINGSFAGVTFTAVAAPGFNELFGTTAADRASTVVAFRYASMAAGLYPTSNLNQFSGSVQVFKAPLTMTESQYPLSVLTVPPTPVQQQVFSIGGLEALDSMPADNYSASFIEGAYTQSTCNEPEFLFRNVQENLQLMPPSGVTLAQAGQFAVFDPIAANLAGFIGMGDMDSIIMLVSTPTGAVNTALVKSWACIEYRPNTNSTLYQFAHDSPAHDPLALEAYRTIAREIPVAVACKDNATFWQRVRQVLSGALTAATYVPGPIGSIAGHVQGITKTLQTLWV